MAILWGVPPPAKRLKASINLLCVRAGQEAVCCVLGPLVGVQTHWAGNRSVPCVGSEDCQIHSLPLEWKGYVPVIASSWQYSGVTRKGHPWVLVVSQELGEDAAAWHRGQLVRVMRPGKKSNGPMTWMPAEGKPPKQLIEAFDVKPYVLRAAALPYGSPLVLKFA